VSWKNFLSRETPKSLNIYKEALKELNGTLHAHEDIEVIFQQLKPVQNSLCPRAQTCAKPFVDKRWRRTITALCMPFLANVAGGFLHGEVLPPDVLFITVYTWYTPLCLAYLYFLGNCPMNHFLLRETRKINNALAKYTKE